MVAENRSNWIDAAKGFALLGVLVNHLVEVFGPSPWFTNPDRPWPSLAWRMAHLVPSGDNPLPVAVRMLGWLGDAAPGVFVLLSGLTLTLSAFRETPGDEPFDTRRFYLRRLTRIYPLYMAAHVAILTGALLVPSVRETLASRSIVLSLLGLRFTDSLFFYLNPSWWFVWLILQLYLVFPFLFGVLRRHGAVRFASAALAFTLASRAAGLIGWNPNGSLYYWMTGLFFGTRLAEFAAGMLLANWLMGYRNAPRRAGPFPLGLLSGAIYLGGLVCSFTWTGALVSNLLVTLGMTGMFAALSGAILRGTPLLGRLLVWTGVESYGIYLLHQPPLQWSSLWHGDSEGRNLALSLSLLAASIPLAWAMSRATTLLERTIGNPSRASILRQVGRWSAVAMVAMLLVEPAIGSRTPHRVLKLAVGLAAAAIAASRPDPHSGWRSTRNIALSGAVVALVAPIDGLWPLALVVGSVVTGLAWSFSRLFGDVLRSRWVPWAISGLVVALATLALEISLARWQPLEARRWGEYPALAPHPTRVYGLKPSQATRLRYNNYDYTLQTNSLGLPGPEIDVTRPSGDTFRILVLGDAFTMPEGLEYSRAYPALLGGLLSDCMEGRPVQVINAGVTGYGPVEETAQLAELAPLLRPDIVVYQFFVNEFEEAVLTPRERLENIGFAGVPSGLQGSFAESQILAHSRTLVSGLKERLSGRPAEWRYRKALLPLYRRDSGVYRPENFGAVRRALGSMKRSADEVDAHLLVAFVPGAVAVSEPRHIRYIPSDVDLSDARLYDLEAPIRHLRAIADPMDVPVLDLTPFLRRHRPQPVYHAESWHWNEEGHKVAAASILTALRDLGYVPDRCSGR